MISLFHPQMMFAAIRRAAFSGEPALLPMVVPAVVLGVGMQLMFARYNLTNSYIGVIIAHTVVA
ncbi:MAG: hypothetical protein ACI4Q4_01695, partial [Oscillospiraceae bacterium]